MEAQISKLYERHFGCAATSIRPLNASGGSHRQYFRVNGAAGTAIGVNGTDYDENHAFITLARHFREKGINVPEVYSVSEDGLCYIQQDLGDECLYDKVRAGRESGSYSESEIELLCDAIRKLPEIQFLGGRDLDYSVCFPDREFNARMVDFDLAYFKYCFLKTSGVEFNEVWLQNDFDTLKDDLLEEFGETFMYRDFQARNIMCHDGKFWFIDFQGGRRGPVFYDLASFVWQAGSHFPDKVKKRLITEYLNALKRFETVDDTLFAEKLRIFALFRTLQVLGAYGFRGRFERKAHFISSIPFAIDNLKGLISEPMPKYPYLHKVLTELVIKETGRLVPPAEGLTVQVSSFSYKKGLPEDLSGHGGGYIFDCRSINNPGRYEQYKSLCGFDGEVIRFLEEQSDVEDFLSHVYAIVDKHVKTFLERGFTHLQVSFGCTGGHHRSVYCACHTAEHIREKFNVRVELTHRELGISKVIR